jgi:hypothetical protein
MKFLSHILATVFLLAVLSLGLTASEQTHAQSAIIKITDAIPATSQTGVIFQTTFTVNHTGGRLILAGNEQGTGRMFVDDNLYIDVTRPDGRVISYTHFLDKNYSPVDLTAYFQSGINTAEVRIENAQGTAEASAHWLVSIPEESVGLPFRITDAIPTVPFAAAGTYFGRFFYVDYSGSGRLLLSSSADGAGLMEVNDTLYVQVTQPNGARNIYRHLKGKFSAVDLTAYFGTGLNLVHLWLENTDGDGGSSAFWLTHLPSNVAPLPVEITPAIPAIAPPNGDFFGRYFYVNYSGNNSLWLASSSNGASNLSVNGTLYFQVLQSNGKRHTYTHSAGSFAPVDLSNYFSVGLNLVYVRLEQLSGAAETTPLFLVERVSSPPSMPTTPSGWQTKITDAIPSAAVGEFFNQTFEVDYREGSVLLSAYADGTGQMFIDDVIYVIVTRPDGTQATYQHNWGAFAPVDLTMYFKLGTNDVQVKMVNAGGPGSASSFWLVNVTETVTPFPIKITDEIASGGGEFLTKH